LFIGAMPDHFEAMIQRQPLSDLALDQLFLKARAHVAFTVRPIARPLLLRLYDLAKWGPTSANVCPARFVFLATRDGKARLETRNDAGLTRSALEKLHVHHHH
jgi:nitroreductase